MVYHPSGFEPFTLSGSGRARQYRTRVPIGATKETNQHFGGAHVVKNCVLQNKKSKTVSYASPID
jgi:hypothetical protein